jgi:ribosomal protein S18 acetylase RimI-like enzyme
MDEETGMMAWNPNPLVRTPMASISPTAMTTVVKSSTALAEAAVKLGDSQRKYLGPMPYAAWNEAFEHGRVTAAVSENQLLGYVMVRLPRKEVAIAHLAVAPEAQP